MPIILVMCVLQLCPLGRAALPGGHALPVPDTWRPPSGRAGGQRGVRHADLPQRAAAEDAQAGRVQHQQVRPRGVSGQWERLEFGVSAPYEPQRSR